MNLLHQPVRWLLPFAAVTALLVGAGFDGFAAAQTPSAATPVASGTLGTSAPSVATSPPAAVASAAPPPPAPSANLGSGTPAVEIGPQDDGKTFTVAVGQTVTVRMGADLDWTVTVEPVAVLPRAPGVNTLVRGVQGIFRAAQPGTATVSAEGRPHCNPGQVCAQFIQTVTATVVVGGAVSGQPAGGVSTPTRVTSPAPAATVLPAAPGAAQGRPPVIAALPNTGTGHPGNQSQGYGVLAIGVLLLASALLVTGTIVVKRR